jgi:dTDP-4-dehydrorhamnose 3,5-epimerase
MYEVKEAKIKGIFELRPKVFCDVRGTSIKPFHNETFVGLGFCSVYNEDLIVTSHKNVLRGLHYQNPPYAQAKLVYCIEGSILDVVLDIRAGSPTYGSYETFQLSSARRNMIYMPEGFAHGYLALEDNSVVMYKMSSVYAQQYEGGIRWDSIGMDWGVKNPILSERDKRFLPFNEFKSEFMYK